MGVKKILFILAALLLLVNTSYAADIKTYHATFNIIDTKLVVEVDIVFNAPIISNFEFELPEDYQALSVYIDGNPLPVDLEDNILKLQLYRNSKISFNYVTQEFIDKTNFLMNMKLDFDADNLEIKLILPEGASLKKPIKEGDITSGSIFPKPARATTDGRSLIFYWEEENMKQGDEISIFTQIELKQAPLGLILLLVAVILIVTGALIYTHKKKPKTKEKIIVKKEDHVEKHLKPDEEQIINVLKRKQGSCEQGTIRVVTGFSKAHLSRLLKELEDRKVIYKEKRGKKNLVFLKK